MSKVKREWCAMLAKLTAPMQAPEAVSAFIAMLPMLPTDDAAYNRSTLEDAARRETGDTAIPNFDKISRVINGWMKAQKPYLERTGYVRALPMPERQPISEAEKERIAALVRQLKADLADAPNAKSSVQPRHLNKLELALSCDEAMLAMRPDLQAALAMHKRAMVDAGAVP